MCLRKILKVRHTLAFRLTLWYAGIFTVCSLVAFIALYVMIASGIREDADAELLEEIEEFSSALTAKGIDEVKSKAVFEAKDDGVDKIFFRILDFNGGEIATSDTSSWEDIGFNRIALKQLINDKNHVFETLTTPEHPDKVRVLYGIIGPGVFLQVGWSLEDEAQFLEKLQNTFIPIMAVLTVFAALIGWFMARRALLGVDEVTRAALDISNGALERRVSVKAGGDEIHRLAATFNTMVERVQALVTGMREMSDNIAHDLRNPLTRMRGVAETTLITGRSTHEYETMAANTIEECDRLLGMIKTMLDISEFEAGAGKLNLEKIDIAGVVRDACQLFHPVAEDSGIAITLKAPVRTYVSGDAQRLQRMVANLLDNAVKYTPSGGTVTVAVNKVERQVLMSVCDTGIGINADDLPRVFKRFYRCDRSRPLTGSGLGLTLAQAIARAHGGNITATSSPGEGSTFTVTLPALTVTP